MDRIIETITEKIKIEILQQSIENGTNLQYVQLIKTEDKVTIGNRTIFQWGSKKSTKGNKSQRWVICLRTLEIPSRDVKNEIESIEIQTEKSSL